MAANPSINRSVDLSMILAMLFRTSGQPRSWSGEKSRSHQVTLLQNNSYRSINQPTRSMDHLAEYRPGGLTRYSPAASRGLDQGESLVVIGLQTSNYQSINQSRNQQYWYGPSSLGLHQRPAEVSIRGKVLWSSVYSQSINQWTNHATNSIGMDRPHSVFTSGQPRSRSRINTGEKSRNEVCRSASPHIWRIMAWEQHAIRYGNAVVWLHMQLCIVTWTYLRMEL